MIVHTYYGLTDTAATAQAFALALAMERGYSSTTARVRGGHRVTASDGKAVDFLKRRAPRAT
jgi:predicted protein tyrosine phosphatase